MENDSFICQIFNKEFALYISTNSTCLSWSFSSGIRNSTLKNLITDEINFQINIFLSKKRESNEIFC